MFLKKIIFMMLSVGFISGCVAAQNTEAKDTRLDPPADYVTNKNTVIVLGMIHSSHVESEAYSLEIVEDVIRKINPDYVLTEIPPASLAEAMRGFAVDGVVTESRTRVFPEYKDVLFPLTKDMDFKIIPTAAWSRGMVDFRRAGLNRIRDDETRKADWDAYLADNKAASEAMGDRGDDPYFIHSDAYDEITKSRFTTYEQRFSEDVGRGDWGRINAAHYKLIESALENHAGEGATVLITYGAGHKYWFLEQLRKRDDIILKNPIEYFEALEGE